MGNRVGAAETGDKDIDIGGSDRDAEKGDNTVEYERDKGTEQVGHHHQADQGIDLKEEKEQDQPSQKKMKSKTQSRQETFEEQAEAGESSQAQGQAINGNDTEQNKRTDSLYVAMVANNCRIIPETKLVIYDNGADYRHEYAQLISDRPISTDTATKANRFSIEIVNLGNTDIIAIGLVPEVYNSNSLPGWRDGSVGYHADDGGIFIENGFPTKRTTPLMKGDTMSVEVYSKEDKTFGLFRRNNEKCYELILDYVGTVFYPCLAMRSRGAAVKLLGNALWISDTSSSERHKDIPTLPTSKAEDGIFISSANTVLKRMEGVCRSLISIYNPTRDTIAFEVHYGESNTVVAKGILDHKGVWAECLKVQQGGLEDKFKVKWIRIGDDEKDTYHKGQDLPLDKALTFEIDGTPMDDEQMMIWSDLDSDDDTTTTTTSLSTFDIEDTDSSLSDPFEKDEDAGPKDYSYKGLIKTLEQALWDVADNTQQLLLNVREILRNMKDEDLIFCERSKGYSPLHYAAKLGLYQFAVLLFKKNAAFPDFKDKDGYTPLHYAAAEGSYNMVELLLKNNANPNSKAKDGKLPLECVIDSEEDKSKDKVATAIVAKMSKIRVVNLFWQEGYHKRKLTIKDLLKAELFETTRAVLTHFDVFWGDYLVAPLELDDKKKCPKDKEYDVKTTTAYQMIAQDSLEELANHECVKLLTEYKWRKYGRFWFLLSFLLYIIFWVALTIAVVTGVMTENVLKYETPVDYGRVVSEVAAFCYAILTLVGEVGQLRVQGCKYFYDAYNYLDLSSSLLIICVLPLRLSDSGAQWVVFAVGYIICTFRSIKFLTVIRGLGHLGHIIIQLIIHDVWKFVLYFLVILIGFSGGLFLALKGDGDLDVHSETSTFWGILFVGVRVLIEGQPFLDYTGTNGYRTFSCIIMLLSLASTCVVMLNIFIAQLSSRYKESYELVEKRFESYRAATIAKLERGEDLTSFIFLCRCCKPLWVQHFDYTCEIQRDGSFKVTLYDLYRWGGMKRVLRHLCRFLKYIVPCWIYRKCREAEWDDDSDVSDCESTCEDCCKKQCYCKPKCCGRRRRGLHSSSSFDATSTDESTFRF